MSKACAAHYPKINIYCLNCFMEGIPELSQQLNQTKVNTEVRKNAPNNRGDKGE